MGVKERRDRERVATRQSILVAAKTLLREQGGSGLTIRQVAQIIEYSPSMVYEYFDSKDAILVALMQEGFENLSVAMKKARGEGPDASERLFALCLAYLDFAELNPETYQLMHGMEGVVVDRKARAQALGDVCSIAQEAVQAWAETEHYCFEDTYGVTELLWSFLHGVASLELAGRPDADKTLIRKMLGPAILAILSASGSKGK